MGLATQPPPGHQSWRVRLILRAFALLYTNSVLYWIASTIPFLGQWRVWQRLALPRILGHDVLEVGSGPGWLLADMVQAGYHCHAVDASPQMVATARRVLRRRVPQADPSLVQQACVQQLPFTDHAFDTVVSTFPAPYISDPDAVREIERVLRPGGRLIIIPGAMLVPNGLFPSVMATFQRFVYGSVPLRLRTNATSPHPGPLIGTMTTTVEEVAGPFWIATVVTAVKSRVADQ